MTFEIVRGDERASAFSLPARMVFPIFSNLLLCVQHSRRPPCPMRIDPKEPDLKENQKKMVLLLLSN